MTLMIYYKPLNDGATIYPAPREFIVYFASLVYILGTSIMKMDYPRVSQRGGTSMQSRANLLPLLPYLTLRSHCG